MSDLHADLPMYVDGELTAEASARFVSHMVDCAQCQHELHDLVHLDVAAARAIDRPLYRRVGAAVLEALSGRWRFPVALTGAAVAAALVLAVQLRQLRMLDSPTRAEKVMLPDQLHKEHNGIRGGQELQEDPPLLAQAWLKVRGDYLSLAEAFLLRGQTQAAQRWLSRAPYSADTLAAHAALDLLLGKPEDAVRDADDALRLSERHSSALWNRALALQAMGLPLAAARSFDAVATLGEPGWAVEARDASARLRVESARRQFLYDEGKASCLAATRGERPYPLDLLDSAPRQARICFYDVLRSAGTPEALAALEPVAAALDAHSGGREPALWRGVTAVKVGATPAREALAKTYEQTLGRYYSKSLAREDMANDWLSLANAARAARQPDIELGALFFLPEGRLDLERYRALALGTGDPWFTVQAEERAAEVEGHQGQSLRALERLRPLEERCQSGSRPDSRVEDRCLSVERAVAYEYLRLHRTLEAKNAGLRAYRRARAEGELMAERGILEELGQVFRVRGELALAHAFLEEVLARSDSCEVAEFVHSELAVAYQKVLNVDEARRQVDALSRCDRAPSLRRMFALADLQRTRPQPGDEDLIRRGAQAARTSGSAAAGDLAQVTYILGKARLERDRVEGERLLRQAISEAEQVSVADRAPDARLSSYTSLILEAGRTGNFSAALSLFAQERRWQAPPPCSVWLTTDGGRLLALSVDTGGRVLGRYDGARSRPITDGEQLVPSDLLAAVRSCPAVQVIARPPLEGRPGLLPLDMAWSEVVRRGDAPAAPGNGPRVVVASPAQPASLGLPALSAPAPVPGEVRLEGPAATPWRVMQAAKHASMLELHVHGLQDPEVADESSLVLSPEPSGGSYSLTARAVRQQVLEGHPLVLLAACHSGDVDTDLRQGDGLPVAFVQAGARAVLAVRAALEDRESEQFFRPLLTRIQAGVQPAIALRDARVAWHQAHGPSWTDAVLLFE